jgi:hypothetical protein
MNIRGIAAAIDSRFAYQVVRGRKGNLARSGRPVKKGNPVLRDLLAHRVLRARKVLLALQVLPRTPFESYASTARPQRAEGSAARTKFVVGYCGARRTPVTLINERTATCPRLAATSPLIMVCAKAAS